MQALSNCGKGHVVNVNCGHYNWPYPHFHAWPPRKWWCWGRTHDQVQNLHNPLSGQSCHLGCRTYYVNASFTMQIHWSTKWDPMSWFVPQKCRWGIAILEGMHVLCVELWLQPMVDTCLVSTLSPCSYCLSCETMMWIGQHSQFHCCLTRTRSTLGYQSRPQSVL